MAKNSGFNYDHPAYVTPMLTQADVLATTGSISGRFAAFTTMVAKSAQFTVVTAGTGAEVIAVRSIAAAGTAITTLGSVTLGTNAAGYTTNVLLTGTLGVGDAFSVLKGADAVGIASVGVEWLISPGATTTV